MKNIKVAIIGECMIEFQKTHDNLFTQSFGGDSLNTAVYLNRMTPSTVQVSYLTGLGVDPFSTQMLDGWHIEGIDTSHVALLEKKVPGLYTISLDDQGERTFNYWRNDAAAKYWLEAYSVTELITLLSQFNLVYLSGISLAILPEDSRQKLYQALTQLKAQKDIAIAFDNNYRKILWTNPAQAQQAYSSMLKLADYAFLTFDDEQALWGDSEEDQAIQRTFDFGVREVIIKHGANPCTVVATDFPYTKVPGVKVTKVVDTTAAGDSFSAGYLSQRLQSLDPVTSATMGHKVASTVIQYKGAIIPKEALQALYPSKN